MPVPVTMRFAAAACVPMVTFPRKDEAPLTVLPPMTRRFGGAFAVLTVRPLVQKEMPFTVNVPFTVCASKLPFAASPSVAKESQVRCEYDCSEPTSTLPAMEAPLPTLL